MSKPNILVNIVENHIAFITIDNISKRNAMTLDMWKGLTSIINDLGNSDSVRVIVLQGAGDQAFVSGADISEFESVRSTKQDIETYNQAVLIAEKSLQNVVKPVIGLVRGVCFGGGLGLLTACDLRYGADNSKFCMPAAKVGLGYDLEGMSSFIKAYDSALVAEMFYTANVYDASDALHYGIIQKVFPLEQIESEVLSVAKKVMINAPLTIAASKLSIRHLNGERGFTEEMALAAIDKCFSSSDYKNAQKAFINKQKPTFIGK